MARKATGQIVERNGKAGRVFALRFRAYGERRYVTLGSAEDGWSRERAEQELRHVLADVERGIWRPQRSAPVTPPERIETFHEFASQWYAERESELRPYTQENYKWALSYHLIPYFGSMLLTDLTIEEIDKYKFAKKHEGKLSNNSINATLSRLSQILEQALEYGKIDRNPARGNRRRLKGEPPARPWIQPEQLLALLEAADRNSRPVYATLAGTGMRPGEVVALNWGDVKYRDGHDSYSGVQDERRDPNGRPSCRVGGGADRVEGQDSDHRFRCPRIHHSAPVAPDEGQPPATTQGGDQGGQQQADQGRHRADVDRGDPVLVPPYLLIPACREMGRPERRLAAGRRSDLHRRPDGPYGSELHVQGLPAGREATRTTDGTAPRSLRSSPRMGTNGHKQRVGHGRRGPPVPDGKPQTCLDAACYGEMATGKDLSGEIERLRLGRVGDALAGHDAWIVGGVARALAADTDPDADVDIAVDADLEPILERLGLPARRHDRFETAVIDLGDGRHADIARTRTETYAAPGALPDVAPAEIGEDLARRDFTVNAIAIAIAPRTGRSTRSVAPPTSPPGRSGCSIRTRSPTTRPGRSGRRATAPGSASIRSRRPDGSSAMPTSASSPPTAAMPSCAGSPPSTRRRPASVSSPNGGYGRCRRALRSCSRRWRRPR